MRCKNLNKLNFYVAKYNIHGKLVTSKLGKISVAKGCDFTSLKGNLQ